MSNQQLEPSVANRLQTIQTLINQAKRYIDQGETPLASETLDNINLELQAIFVQMKSFLDEITNFYQGRR
jgi:hypothetical protein